MNEALFWREKVIAALQAKTHPQQRLSRPFDIKRLAEERGFHIGENHLETWDKLGIFHPALRVQYPFSYRRNAPDKPWPGWEGEPLGDELAHDEGVVTLIHDWSVNNQKEEAGVHPAAVEVPSTSNFTPWNDYQQWDGIRMPVSTGGVYFHPYQIFRLMRVIRGCQCRTHFIDFTTSEKTASYIQQDLESSKQAIQESEVQELKVLFLLLSIEDRYLPSIRGMRHQLHLTSFNFRLETSSWFEFEKTFDARRVLENLPFSIEDIKAMRHNLAWQGWNLDPNHSWFELMNHIPHEHRRRLRGDALFAWDFYEGAQLIGDFLCDATGEPQPHVDDLLHGGKWKKDFYGIASEEIDYKTGNALKRILAHFTIDLRLKVLLMVEGASEVQYIRVWCEQQGIDLANFGVQLFDMGGIPSDKNPHLRQIMKAAHEEDAAVVVVMDNEDKAPEILKEWLDESFIKRIFTMSDLNGLNHPIGGMLWEATHGEPCFEEANFSPDELISALADLLELDPNFKGSLDREALKVEVHASYEFLKQESATKISWFNAMKRTGWRMGFSFNNSEKTEFAACLARRFGKTDRPIHRLTYHARSCALLSAAYGPANPDGGYGLFL